jgi:hypothetical protein
MNKIKVFWWKLNKGHGNFGDELNPYLIQKLSNLEVEHVQINILRDTPLQTLRSIARKIKNRKYDLKDFCKYKEWRSFFIKNEVILGIGSVISVYKYSKTIVWGAGIIKQDATINPAYFKAVRGKYTQARMVELGLNPPSVIGDPALLLPLVLNPKAEKHYKLAIIPHYKHFKEIDSIIIDSNILVINLLDSIETITSQIKSSEVTISTSLHGLIVSHAYNIPSLWVKFDQGNAIIGGDDIKFKDYFSSVNLPEYNVLDYGNLENSNLDDLLSKIITEPENQFLPDQKVIKEIQSNLINVAPFPILEKYKCRLP